MILYTLISLLTIEGWFQTTVIQQDIVTENLFSFSQNGCADIIQNENVLKHLYTKLI